MNSSSRLLFAAARGARIVRRLKVDPRCAWVEAPLLVFGKWVSDWEYGIHPDDKHLQYGPISTALREYALRAPNTSVFATHLGNFWLCQSDYMNAIDSSKDDASLFLLILAEALADEGL